MTFSTETAETVFKRTYSRTKPSGEQETWEETVTRVVDGNLALVDGRYIEDGERDALLELIGSFRVLPAGRHLKSSGVNPFALNNCWAAGWDPKHPEEHFTFSLLRLAEGGGVGANYSSRYLEDYPSVAVPVEVHIVCDPDHADYLDLVEAGLISTEYSHEWAGAFEVGDSREGWAGALGDLIRTSMDSGTAHTARVFDVSRVRRKGAPLKQFGGTASGPEPFAKLLKNVGQILKAKVWVDDSDPNGLVRYLGGKLNGLDAAAMDHEIAQCIISGGVRRSARMSIMHWRDPLIVEWLALKAQGGHWTTNVSVEIDDEFIAELEDPNSTAGDVFKMIAAGMLRNGEPGIWNSSLTAAGEVDGTYTTNPCGEATLTPWEPCNLGSVNLGAFVTQYGDIDDDGLREAHRYLTRYLIRATFADVADPKSAAAIAKYRRIGVGHLGFADFLVKIGVKYSEAARKGMSYELELMAQTVTLAAREYANILRIPVPIKTRVIAPTGTTSKLAGVSGEATHPPFAGYFIRRIRFSDLEPTEVAQVEEYRRKGYHVEPDKFAANTSVVSIPTKDALVDAGNAFQHAGELTLQNMLDVQALYQEYWADQAVSYTVNVDPGKYTAEELMRSLRPYLHRLKGTTVFPEMSFEQPPYERIDKATYERLIAEIGEESTDTSYDELCASGACPI